MAFLRTKAWTRFLGHPLHPLFDLANALAVLFGEIASLRPPS